MAGQEIGRTGRDLQPVSLEIPTVSEELYNKTREALAELGFTFITSIGSVSIGQLATDEVTSKRLGYVNASEDMRSIVPPKIEVAIDPKHFRIDGSNYQPTDTQIRIIQEHEAVLKGKLPEDVRDLISMLMPNASTLVQLDAAFQEQTGNVLFTNWFARTDDKTVPGLVAGVGRRDPSHPLDVYDWSRDYGNVNVFAASVVVLSRKLAAPMA